MKNGSGMVLALALAAVAPAAGAQQGGFEEGYRQGFQDGYREGLAAGRPRADPEREAGPRRGEPWQAARSILVTQADYGDGYTDCDATSYVGSRLNGRRSGSIQVTNGICGDPAPGRRKSLRVIFFCGAREKEVTEFENTTLMAACD